jgi:hypothetical protein
MSPRACTLALGALLCAAACGRSSSKITRPTVHAPPRVVLSPTEEKWGIKLVSLRPTMNATMLDFRYKVVDADKARRLFDRKVKPYLLDPITGVALGMPDDTKLGALRASVRNPPIAGKLYYVLFANGYGTVKRGNAVTIVMGDCKLENVVVQ